MISSEFLEAQYRQLTELFKAVAVLPEDRKDFWLTRNARYVGLTRSSIWAIYRKWLAQQKREGGAE